MTELRKIRKIGGSLSITIPLEMGFSIGDWVKFERDGDKVVLSRVVIE